MPGFIDYPLQGVMPANRTDLSSRAAFSLPVGGPVGVGGSYAQGQALGLIGGPAVSETRTATITTNGATGGIGYWIYYADLVYSGLSVAGSGGLTANAVNVFPTGAQMQAALAAAVPLWAGNVTIAGAAGGPYTLNFVNLLANRRIGGLLQFNWLSSQGGTPSQMLTVTTQQGSKGTFQADIYAQATNNAVDGLLVYPANPGPLGSESTEFGSTGQAKDGFTCWVTGIFQVGVIGTTTNPTGPAGWVGLDANAMTLKKLVFAGGTTLNDVGVQVQIR
jgi:hypothetical protein